MEIIKQFPEELFSRDDAAGLQNALARWEWPKLDALMALLDLAAEKPHTTACLLQYIHTHFPPDSIAAERKHRQKKQLGLLDWESEDWSEIFSWEAVGQNCRILSYLGQDEEVLIPEEISGQPVIEVARRFFLQNGTIRRLLVPEGIQAGTILPGEAREFFGKSFGTPEIFCLERESPLPHLEKSVAILPFGNIQTGQHMAFGRYAREEDRAVVPIIWRVLQRESNRVLLIADRVLEYLPYHRNRSAVLWPDCDLRCWLNEYFLPAAFSPEEQALLLPVETSGSPNPVFHTRDTSYSQDRVFLLSPEEWRNRISSADNDAPLWLRMPGLNTQYAVTLEKADRMDYQGRLVNDSTVGVLPAVWIQI